MRTRVCITVDTEFSIAGAFADQQRVPVADQIVWCNVDGSSEGLGFMLNCLSKYRIPATFFVETLQRHYFRHDPMRDVARILHDKGHDVQLHSHPCWALFKHEDWFTRARAMRNKDSFFGRAEDETVALIEQGLDTFRDWGVPAPTVFRSGNVHHDRSLYRALARTGIPYSSSIALAVFNSGDPALQLYSGQHRFDGVTELPILTFQDFKVGARPHLKSLTIAGTGTHEMRNLLDQAHAAGIPLVTILTHPFEYVQTRDTTLRYVKRHGVNQQRLDKLCSYLACNGDRFEAVGMGQAAAAVHAIDSGNILLASKPWHYLPRMLTQVAYDRYGRIALAHKYRHTA